MRDCGDSEITKEGREKEASIIIKSTKEILAVKDSQQGWIVVFDSALKRRESATYSMAPTEQRDIIDD